MIGLKHNQNLLVDDDAEHAGVPEHYIFGRGRDLSERTRLVHIVEVRTDPGDSILHFVTRSGQIET